ncbi:LLM class F420-dependent oxidoreductase [Microbacterium atlanticum]|uniref:LLM class F420-dependent oxidoreductase n=1 Tax=Microbacterium atlanticum TaxID=2782168 RepID=UPI0018880FDB|nr:LLM class F420-dependent oxidoreductase [Microbacterium atlanticum]
MTEPRHPSSHRPLRIGVQLAPQHGSYLAYRDAVLRAEEMGVDAIFNWDHFFPLTAPLDAEHFEAWTVLAAMAEQTERVEFGPLVNCSSYRNPDLQADMARTVDHISARATGTGRLIFGTGSGWAQHDYDEYGYEFGTVGSRLDALAEDLPRIRSRWDRLDPPPTRRIPVLIGGQGERKTLRLVARHADIWHTFTKLDDLPRKISVLHDWCAREQRDPADIELSTGYTVRGFGPLLETDAPARLYELGFRLIIAAIDGPEYDLSPLVPLLEWRDLVNGF